MTSSVTIFNAIHTTHNLDNYILNLIQFLLQERYYYYSPSQVLQSTVGLGFQYNLPPFLMVCAHRLPVNYSQYTYLSPLQPHLSTFYVVFLLFLIPSIVAVAISFGILSLCILSI